LFGNKSRGLRERLGGSGGLRLDDGLLVRRLVLSQRRGPS
jgi:hypothetical protein